jgi:hypothetical protein
MGVHQRIEVVPPAEDGGGDGGLGQAVAPPGHRLLDDEAQELAGPAGGVEIGAGEDSGQLPAKRPAGRNPGFE